MASPRNPRGGQYRIARDILYGGVVQGTRDMLYAAMFRDGDVQRWTTRDGDARTGGTWTSASGAAVADVRGAGGPRVSVCGYIIISSLSLALPRPSTPPKQDGEAKGGEAIGACRARGQPKGRLLPQPAPTIAWAGAGTATRTMVRTRRGRGAAIVIGPLVAGDSERSHAAPGADGESAINRMAPNATIVCRAVKICSAVVDGGSMLQLWAWVLWIVCRWFLVECADKLIIQCNGAACLEATAATGAVPRYVQYTSCMRVRVGWAGAVVGLLIMLSE